MAVVLGLLLIAVLGVGIVGIGMSIYYVRVRHPELLTPSKPAKAPAPVVKKDPLAVVVEQLQELAVLRDKGILTSKEFAAKKSQLLERI
jgi:hypothetical protein